MSTTIDQKVVEMRFDNKNFETNVATTMSTLDKFKQKLNLSGATKGLEEINAASKKVDMAGLGTAVDNVRSKFSALEVMGVTALANITNSVVNASKRMLRSFTVEPIKTGFNEYELKMGAIQTIMASTGESLDTVNQKLDELNKYSDDTIYSFQDMTQNIGKFTNAGVKLDDAVAAIKGVSNEAALSGANANEASRAMYNFAQALSAGYVKLIDWKSIENANMATVSFKEELIKTAVEMGTLTKVTDGYKTAEGEVLTSTKNFNESLQDQWMTSNVLIETLKKYADTSTDIGAKATQAATEVKTFTQMMDTLKESAQSGWAQTWEIVFGDFEEGKTLWTNISKVLGGIIDKMTKARNTMLSGALGSYWDKLYGKINAAGIETSEFKTRLQETAKKHGVAVDDLIKKYGSLEAAMSAGKVANYKDIIKETIKSFLGLSEATDDVTKSTEDYAEIVKKVIRGDFGNGAERVKKLTEAGYNYAKVQNKVNEELGFSYRHLETLTEEQKKNADSLVKLSDEQLKSKGYTEDQVKALRELQEAADDADSSISELIDGVGKMSGRDMLIEIFKKIGTSISDIFGGIKKAWKETFDSEFNISDVLYNIITSLYNMSDALVIGETAVDQVTRIAKGVFALIKLFTSFSTKLLFVGFDILKGILGLTNVDLLEFAARLGDGIVKIKDMIFNNKLLKIDLDKVADSVVGVIAKFIDWFKQFRKWPGVAKSIDKAKDAINGFVDAVTDLFSGKITLGEFFAKIWDKIGSAFEKVVDACPGLQRFVDLVKELFNSFKGTSIGGGLFDGISEFFGNLKERFSNAKEIGKNVIDGIIEGLKDGTTTLGPALLDIGKMIIDIVCEILGIHSPSRVFMAIGGMIIAGLVLGLQNGEGNLLDNAKELGSKLVDSIKGLIGKAVDFVKGVDFGAIIATGFGVGILLLINKITNVVNNFINPFTGIFKSVSKVVEDLGDAMESNIKADAWKKRSVAILNIAKAIALLAGSIALLTYVPQENLWRAVGVIGSLVGMMVGMIALMAILDKLNITSVAQNSLSLVAVAGSLLIMATALAILSKIDSDDMNTAIAGLTASIIGITFVLVALSKLTSGKNAVDATKVGVMLLLMAGAMLIMTKIIKSIGEMDGSTIAKGLIVITTIELLFAGIIAVSKLSGKHASKAGSMLLKMAVAMGIMVLVIKLISYLEYEDIAKGLAVMAAIEGLFSYVIALSALAGDNASKAGTMLLMMAGAMLIITYVIKQISKMSSDEIERGLIVIAAIEALFMGVIYISKYAGENAMKAGVMLLAMSAALLILTGVLAIISYLSKDPAGLYQAVGVVAVLELLFMGLIKATEKSKDCMKNLIVMTVAIALLAGALVGLSFLDPKKLGTAAASLSAVMAVFGLLIFIMSKIDNEGKKMGKTIGTLVVLTVIIAILGVVIAGIAGIDNPNNALVAAGALSMLLAVLAGAAWILSNSKSFNKGGMLQAYGGILILTGVLAALSGLLVWLNTIDSDKALTNATILSALLLVLTGVGALLALIGMGATNILLGSVGLLALTGVMSNLARILISIGDMGIKDGLTNVMTLSALLIVLTGVSAALALIGFGTATVLLGSAGLLALGGVIYFLAAILKAIGDLGIQNGMTNVTMLCELLTVMTNVCVALAIVGPFASLGVAALAELTLLMGAIGVFAVAVGALVDKYPILEEFLDKGIAIFEKLAYGIGSIVGNLISGFMNGIVDGLPAIGLKLSLFATALIPFISIMRTIDGDVLAGIGIVTGAILALVAADLIAGIASFINMGSSFSSLGLELSAFAVGAQPFFDIMSSIDQKVFDSIKSLAAALLAFTAAELLDAINIFGNSSISEFGSELAEFGPCLSTFAESISDIDDATLESIKKAAEAGKALADMAKAFPNSGGLIADIFGDNTADEFGKQLEGFGKSLMLYGESVSGIEEYVGSIDESVKAGKALAELADAIPESGGFIADFLGDNTIDGFGTQLEGFGESLMAYGESVSGIESYTKSMSEAVKAGKALAELADAIPESGGFIADFFGDNAIDDFGKQLEAFGEGLMAYAVSVSGIESYKTSVDESSAIADKMVEVANSIHDDLDWDWGDSEMSKMATGLEALGDGMLAYAEGINSIDSLGVDMESAKTTVEGLVDMVNTVHDTLDGDLGQSEITKLGESIADFGEDLASYADNVKGIGNVSNATTVVEGLVTVMNKINEAANSDTYYEVDNFSGDFENFGDDITEFAEDLRSASDIPTHEGVVDAMVRMNDKIINGYNDETDREKVLKFGECFRGFAAHIATYAATMGEVPEISSTTDTVDTLFAILDSIKTYVSANDGYDTIIEDFGTQIFKIGKILDGFVGMTSDFDSSKVDEVTRSISDLVTAMKNLGDIDISASSSILGENGFSSLATSIHDTLYTVSRTITEFVDGTVTYVSGKIDTFNELGVNIMGAFGEGMVSIADAPVKVFTRTLSDTITVTTSKVVYSAFWSAGAYLVEGFAKGINDNTYLAEAKAKAMAEAAEEAARKALDINSPSKVFRKIGNSVPEGFAQGIDNLSGLVKSSTMTMTDDAVASVGYSIARIAGLVNDNIDAQPTIRPVLDLSDVKSGVGTLGGMLNFGPSVDVLANVGAINMTMNRRIQNGATNDVVTAIKNLGKDLGSMERNSYNINGINYTEGDDVSEALQTIVRAAVRERRV